MAKSRSRSQAQRQQAERQRAQRQAQDQSGQAKDPMDPKEQSGDVPARFQPEGTGQFQRPDDATETTAAQDSLLQEQAQGHAPPAGMPPTLNAVPGTFPTSLPANAQGRFEFDPNRPSASREPAGLADLDKNEVQELAEEIMTGDMGIDPASAYRRAVVVLQSRQRFHDGTLFQGPEASAVVGVRGGAGVRPAVMPTGDEAEAQRQERRNVTSTQAYRAVEYARDPAPFLKIDTPSQKIPNEPVPVDFRDIQEEEGRRAGAVGVTM
jgi:hypothetical protein